jgi:hypothetical protein
VEKGFEKIILQFTTDFENTLLFKGVGGGSLLNTPKIGTVFFITFIDYNWKNGENIVIATYLG